MPRSQSEIRSEFIENMGLMAQDEGMARIAGRIMGLLVFDGVPYSFGDLATELQVSRGSVSANVRLLVERGVIRKIAKPGDRQDYFQIGETPYLDIFTRLVTRAGQNAERITSTINELDGGDAGLRQRLDDFADFYKAMAEAAQGAAERLTRAKGGAD